jgi:AcrR family transcriptional regulator
MSYRHLDNIDEKIIDATILVGATNGANKLSTKEIAKACGISEFVIYDHFKSKEKLLSIADQKVAETFSDAAQEQFRKSTDFDTFWNGMVDLLIANPNLASFSINYGHIFPRISKPADFDDFLVTEIQPIAKESFTRLGVTFEADYLYTYMWMWLARSIFTYAQFIIGKSLEDRPESRNISCAAARNGLFSFKKN